MKSTICFPTAMPASIAVLVLAPMGMAAQANAQRLVRGPIDETHRVVLPGNTCPEANANNDLGAVEDSLPLEHMQLLLRRPAKLQQELDAYTESLSDKASSNYHRWLTAEQFGARFGVAQEDIDAVTGWLALHGFQVNTVYPNRITIDFSGTAGEVREAFTTEIHAYDVNGVRHIANDRDPQVPAALAPAIAGIVSLNDFRPHPMFKPRAQYTYGSSGNQTWAVTPADLATIYNLNPLFKNGITGKGQTVVVIEDTDVYTTKDWTNFRSKFGLSGYTSGKFIQVHPGNCADPGVNPNGDDMEAILDAEYASASAPNATIELASCNNTSTDFGGYIALVNILNANSTPPAVISISYGDCESDMGASANLAFKDLYNLAVTRGVSVFVSAGDEGAASCDANDSDESYATHGISISGFASTVYNVAVGGTDFADTYLRDDSTYWNNSNTASFESAKSYIPEIPWNYTCASALLAKFVAGSVSYGKSGFCNSSVGENDLPGVTGGSGGPSACARGTASTADVTSGTCKGWPKPSWQSLVGNPADGVRDIPDVSLFASNGTWGHYFVYCFSNKNHGGLPCTGSPAGWSGAGGTSFSSPIMAGIQALVNEKTDKRWGNPNPVYYEIARAEYGSAGSGACNSMKGKSVNSSCVFYDVTLGDMAMNCRGAHNCYLDGATNGVLSTSNSSYDPAYKTKVGWDFATGIGTLNASNLVNSNKW
jgi:subtilase family serine protease